MMIGSMAGTNNSMQAGRLGMNMQTDAVTKNIQRQIANAQKQLQEISSNKDMTMEEKMKKRQEIQKEIADLNLQLRQHQIEQRKEQQSKNTSMDNMLDRSQDPKAAKPGNKVNGLSQANMQAMISAESSMKQAQAQGSVVTKMEGRAGVLKAEIKQDAGRNTKPKEAELAEVEQKAKNTSVLQMNTLANVNETMKEAAKAEQGIMKNKTDAKTEGKDSKKDKTDNNQQKIGEISENMTDKENNMQTKENAKKDVIGEIPQFAAYTHVDVYL